MSNVATESAPQRATGDAVTFEGVTKRFGGVTALHEANLSIRQGELMTLLGPSGCGKTTMLNLIAGFFMPDSGEITIQGARVSHLPTYKREIGMMFQNYALFPHMTVEGNVGYGLRMRGVNKADIQKRVSQALSLVKLHGLGDRKPRQLSGGQQQRVAIARALVINPKVLLLDEPFSALDKNLRGAMQVEVKEIQRKLGVTTVFVTHDQGEALSLSDRVTVMSDGRILQVGTPEEIYRRPAQRFVASLIGDANVLKGTIERIERGTALIAVGDGRISVSAAELNHSAANAPVDLFVRCERLAIADTQPAACRGQITALVYQGSHVDVHIETDAAVSGKVLLRAAGHESTVKWRVGETVGMTIDATDAVAFPTSR
jgi:putative spermidine/putrescine transport system ATP-binding protein/spermidine/putrescine transport system ATP-binding protein